MTPGGFDEWLAIGTRAGWVSPPYCAMHDLGPITPTEEAEIEAGDDPCITAMRVWVLDER